MPILPEEIEEHLRSMSRAKMVQLPEQEQQPAGDPPGSEGETDPTTELKPSLAHIDG